MQNLLYLFLLLSISASSSAGLKDLVKNLPEPLDIQRDYLLYNPNIVIYNLNDKKNGNICYIVSNEKSSTIAISCVPNNTIETK